MQTAPRQVRETTFRDAERRGPPSPHLVRNHTRPRATKSTRVVVPRAARNAARSGGDTACARTPPPSRVRARRSSRRSRNPPVVIADDHPRGGDGRRRRDRGGGPARRRRRARRRREGTTRSVPCFVVRGGPSGSPRKRTRGGVLPRPANLHANLHCHASLRPPRVRLLTIRKPLVVFPADRLGAAADRRQGEASPTSRRSSASPGARRAHQTKPEPFQRRRARRDERRSRRDGDDAVHDGVSRCFRGRKKKER